MRGAYRLVCFADGKTMRFAVGTVRLGEPRIVFGDDGSISVQNNPNVHLPPDDGMPFLVDNAEGGTDLYTFDRELGYGKTLREPKPLAIPTSEPA